MQKLQRFTLVAVGLAIALHGIAHAPGALGSLDLATFEDVSRQPNLLFTSAGDGLLMLLGVLWAVAGVLFILGGGALAVNWHRAVPAVIGALAVSLPLTILWYQDAVAGLVMNVVLLAVLPFLSAQGIPGLPGKRMTSAN